VQDIVVFLTCTRAQFLGDVVAGLRTWFVPNTRVTSQASTQHGMMAAKARRHSEPNPPQVDVTQWGGAAGGAASFVLHDQARSRRGRLEQSLFGLLHLMKRETTTTTNSSKLLAYILFALDFLQVCSVRQLLAASPGLDLCLAVRCARGEGS